MKLMGYLIEVYKILYLSSRNVHEVHPCARSFEGPAAVHLRVLITFSLLTSSFALFSFQMYTKKSVHGHLKALLRQTIVSDWFLLFSFAKNMEQSVFSELVLCLYSGLVPIAAATSVNMTHDK